jgi:hypothetical protein
MQNDLQTTQHGAGRHAKGCHAKGRHVVFVGIVPAECGFSPQSPGDWPPQVTNLEILLPRCTTAQGVQVQDAREFNAEQIRNGFADRRWALLAHSLSPRRTGGSEQGG